MSDPPRCRLYLRLSTKKQVIRGSGELQAQVGEDYCSKKGWNLVETYEDMGVSGKATDTTPAGFKRLLKDLKSGEYVLVTCITRFTRHPAQFLINLGDISSRGAKLACVEQDLDFNTQGDSLMASFVAAYFCSGFGLSSKISTSLNILRTEGRPKSRTPFGYRFTGLGSTTEADPDQQRIIQRIRDMTNNGLDPVNIADILNCEEENRYLITEDTPENKIPRFHGQTIRTILDRKVLPVRKRTITFKPLVSAIPVLPERTYPLVEVVAGTCKFTGWGC